MTRSDMETALSRALEMNERVVLILCGAPSSGLARRYPTRVYQFLRGEQTAVLAGLGLAAEGYRPLVAIEARYFTGRASALLDAHADACPSLCCVVLGTVPADVVLPGLCRTTAATGSEAAAGVFESWLERGGVWAVALG